MRVSKTFALAILFKYFGIKKSLFFLIERYLFQKKSIQLALKDGLKMKVNGWFLYLLSARKSCVDPLAHIYNWSFNKEHWIGTYNQIEGLTEYLKGEFDQFYAFNWKDKKVLDVGGFIGDSARFFLKKGAKQVTIYEASDKNIQALITNLKEFSEKFTVFHQAICKQNGYQEIYSATLEGSNSFGLIQGEHKIFCEGITFSTILQTQSFDIAKIDCEGAEKFLKDVHANLLKKVLYWIIETHSDEIAADIIKKFQTDGFKKIKEFYVMEGVQVLHFQLESP